MRPTKKYHKVTSYHREPGGLRRLDFFVDRIEQAFQGKMEPQAIKILDIGCGKGNVALPLSYLGYRVTGVDYDAESIREARKNAEELGLGAIFHEGSLERVSGQKFDVIVASEVLEHQINPVVFLKDLTEFLALDGILLLSVPNGKSLEERIRWFTTHTRFGRWLKRNVKRFVAHQSVQSAAENPHEQYFSYGELRRTLRQGNFKIRYLSSAAAVFKEFYYLWGRMFMKRGSRSFHAWDSFDARVAPYLPVSMMDGWLIETRPLDPDRPLVMHVVTSLHVGGAEKLVCELARLLPDLGYDVLIVALFDGGSLEEFVERHKLRLMILKRRGFLAVRTFFELKEIMAREEPDIVHTHLFGADVLGRVAAWLSKVPVIIVTEHSVNRGDGTVKRLIKRLLSRITTAFIAVSKEAKKYMSEVEGVQKQKIRVIENGIDLSRIKKRPAAAFHDVPRLICVSRIVAQKNHSILFKALALVKRPWMLQMVGEGEYKGELCALAERLGISAKIYWLGYRTDVPELLANSDLFCFPTKWEGLGLAFIEAAAAGIPIVASDLPVFREVLSSKQAVYVPVHDVPAWAKAMDHILADPMPAVRRAEEAALVIGKKFSILHMAAAYAKLYREFLKK